MSVSSVSSVYAIVVTAFGSLFSGAPEMLNHSTVAAVAEGAERLYFLVSLVSSFQCL